MQEYRGDLGTALTDVSSAWTPSGRLRPLFRQALRRPAARLRRPVVWGERRWRITRSCASTPTKRLVFSDGLDIPTALKLYRHFADRVHAGLHRHQPQQRHGAGDTAHRDEADPLQCQPVAKLSDSPGKTMCDDQTFLAYAARSSNVKV